MKILILNADTDEFLRWFYGSSPGLEYTTYDAQLRARYETLYGFSDFYSRNFAAHGHEAREIFTSNIWLQSAWAREHGIATPSVPTTILREDGHLVSRVKRALRRYKSALRPLGQGLGLVRTTPSFLKSILLSQVEEMQPDVIINQTTSAIDADTMRLVKANGRTLVVQQGVALAKNVDLSPYDFGMSMLPWVVDRFREQGIQGEQVHLAFESSVLERLGPPPAKDIEVSFVGNIAPSHGTRIKLLEQIAERFPIALWLPSLNGLPPDSPLRKYHRGQAWGRGMYDVLRRSRIVWNSHIDDARDFAGNMRLFEATGVGSFLMTDNKSNLATLLRPGEEVAAYDSVDDCLRGVEHFLEREDDREEIARRGQAKTLGEHSYRRRTEQILGLVAKYGR
ncbi:MULTISPECIES: glycosyltransferase [unclassified Devosia]|uniref:CgeB family protein n=1 Tax=unclassified Devosia TaxID=196773 RepID=UPI0008689664|nr:MULTISPECIES: glycosyltransferase [unclassified Devosia]MBN9363127.1 glycosyltransferase [Devosia sp.]ODS87404.1 MAG: hypothetical protein ABS47_12240 [Devosia sp. SCN 66-27]OJX23378.1 MAG: hypothetical protein BGO83_00380 [Devosia sp. 66-14]